MFEDHYISAQWPPLNEGNVTASPNETLTSQINHHKEISIIAPPLQGGYHYDHERGHHRGDFPTAVMLCPTGNSPSE